MRFQKKMLCIRPILFLHRLFPGIQRLVKLRIFGQRLEGRTPIAHMLHKPLIQATGRNTTRRYQCLNSLHAIANAVECCHQRINTVIIHVKSHKLTRYKIPIHQMHRRFWIRKKTSEITYSREPLAIYNMLKFRTQPLPPRHILLRLFIDRNPLRQPARHAIVGLLQRNHMHKLVPQHLLPIHRTGWSRPRRIHCNQPPKTNAQMPCITRQTNRPHHKHIVIVKYLHHHGRL